MSPVLEEKQRQRVREINDSTLEIIEVHFPWG